MRESPAKKRSGLPIPATACSFFPESSDHAKAAAWASTRYRPAGASRMRNAPGLGSAPFTTVASTWRPARSRTGPAGSRKPLPTPSSARLRERADGAALPADETQGLSETAAPTPGSAGTSDARQSQRQERWAGRPPYARCALLRRLLHREHYLAKPRLARGVHDADHRLIVGIVVGVDDHDRLLHACAGATEFFGECCDVPELDRLSLQQILPVGADHYVDFVGSFQLLFRVRTRQVDLQFGESGVGRSQHQEDDDDQEHVDHRNQVDFRIFFLRAGEPHT